MTATKPVFRLVDDLSSAAYNPEFVYFHTIQTNNEAQEIEDTCHDLRSAIAFLDIARYKLITYPDKICVHLTNHNDFQKLSVFMNDDNPREYIKIPNDYTGKQLEATRNELRQLLDCTEIRDKIDVRVDYRNHEVIVEAQDNITLLKYCALFDDTAETVVQNEMGLTY